MRPDAMRLHRQLALVDRQRSFLLRRQIVRELIDGGIADFDRAVLVGERLRQPLDRLPPAERRRRRRPRTGGTSRRAIAERCGVVPPPGVREISDSICVT